LHLGVRLCGVDPASQQGGSGTVPPQSRRCRPYAIHTILTDNGVQFTNSNYDRQVFAHIFDRVCRKRGIEHLPIKPGHAD